MALVALVGVRRGGRCQWLLAVISVVALVMVVVLGVSRWWSWWSTLTYSRFIRALPGEQNVAARRGYIHTIGSHHAGMYAGTVGEEVIDALLSQITTIEVC